MSSRVLTGKQQWRKFQKYHGQYGERGPESDSVGSGDMVELSRSSSMEGTQETTLTFSSGDEANTAQFDLSSHKTQEIKPRKRLSFNTVLKVVLIPCIKEYKDAGIAEEVWLNSSDLNSYKQSAMIEVLDFMDQTGEEDVSKALKQLYCAHDGEQSNIKHSSFSSDSESSKTAGSASN